MSSKNVLIAEVPFIALMVAIVDGFVMLDVFSAPDYIFGAKCDRNDREPSIGLSTTLGISGRLCALKQKFHLPDAEIKK